MTLKLTSKQAERFQNLKNGKHPGNNLRGRRRIPYEKIAAIKEALAENKAVTHIAEETGISEATIRKVRRGEYDTEVGR